MTLGYVLLYVEDVLKSVKFYEDAFGLKQKFVAPSEDGAGSDYAEMDTGGTTLGFVSHALAGSHGFSYEPTKASGRPAAVEVAFLTHDVQAAFQRAVEAGCEPMAEPSTKPWGQTVCWVRDRDGFLVEICTPVEPPIAKNPPASE